MAKKDTASKEDRRKAAMAAIQKKHGTESIGFAYAKRPPVPSLPTGFLGLDHRVLGVGGLPRGRIIEYFAQNSVGKTTLMLHTIAAVQKAGGYCAFIDAEHALDAKYATGLGVNFEELAFSQPENGEQALEIVEDLCKSGAFDLIVLDSVAALIPKAELEGEIGHGQVGGTARLLSLGIKRLTQSLSESKTTLVMLNQMRAKIGMTGYGGPTEDTTGGNALKFYASVRLEAKRIAQIKGKNALGEDAVIGHKVKFKCVKNKVASPFQETVVDLMYDRTGFSAEGEILDLALQYSIVDKAGASYTFANEKIGYGRDATIANLRTKAELKERLSAAIIERLTRADSEPSPEPDESIDDETGEVTSGD